MSAFYLIGVVWSRENAAADDPSSNTPQLKEHLEKKTKAPDLIYRYCAAHSTDHLVRKLLPLPKTAHQESRQPWRMHCILQQARKMKLSP